MPSYEQFHSGDIKVLLRAESDVAGIEGGVTMVWNGALLAFSCRTREAAEAAIQQTLKETGHFCDSQCEPLEAGGFYKI